MEASCILFNTGRETAHSEDEESEKGLKGMKLKKWLTGVLAAAMALSLAACSDGGAESADAGSEDSITLGFAQVGSESEWRTANTDNIKAAAEAAGVTLQFSDAQQKQENQIKAIRSFIASDVDVISFCPIVETGWDTLLKKVNKGVNAQQMLEAGLRLKEAGLELWAIVMLGLAGPGEASATHVQKTVEMINAMAPRHLSAMTYMPVEGTPMYQDILAGRFTCLTPREALLETRGLIAGLTVDPLHITANHPSNYLPIKGGLPEDRDRLLALVDSALNGETDIRKGRPRIL